MDSSKIKIIIVAISASFAALYLGITAATAQFETLAWTLGASLFVTCLLLGRRVFLLIPLMTSLGLTLPLPGSFTTGFIFQIIVLAFLSALFLMRRLPMRPGFTELEAWCLLLLLTVLQTYMRNPIGLSLFGSDSVGAKPYVVFGLSTLSALVLSLLLIDPKDFKLWVYLSFTGSILNFLVGSIGWIFPQTSYVLGASFSTDINRDSEAGQATRISFVRNISVALATWISSRISPLRACFHPLWLPLVLAAFAFAGLSGFRSQLIMVGTILFIGVCYRGGFKSVLASSIIGVGGLVFLAFVNLIAPLPLNIQRSLTFLPGTWDSSLKDSADDSTEWRVEMWKEALLTDRWIANKWLGDGLGFTKAEHERMLALSEGEVEGYRGSSGLTNQQENMMISGGYHSGPVQTIRTTGYVGLAILLMAMIRLAVHAHRQILRCRGTEWFPTAIFLGAPMIATPFLWTFVFGNFDTGASGVMLGSALLRMMENNLPLSSFVIGDRKPYILRRQSTLSGSTG